MIQQDRLYPLPMWIGDVCVGQGKLYLSEMHGDADGYGNRALIHVFNVLLDAPLPVPDPVPPIVVDPPNPIPPSLEQRVQALEDWARGFR